MHFQLIGSQWRICFSEADGRTFLRRVLLFAGPEKIFKMAEQGHAAQSSHWPDDLNRDIKRGGGTIWLHLTHKQYLRLTK